MDVDAGMDVDAAHCLELRLNVLVIVIVPLVGAFGLVFEPGPKPEIP